MAECSRQLKVLSVNRRTLELFKPATCRIGWPTSSACFATRGGDEFVLLPGADADARAGHQMMERVRSLSS